MITKNTHKSGKIVLIAGICAVAVALLSLLGVFIRGVSLKNGDTVFPNVCVSGVNIGGMTAPEANTALEESLTKTYAARTLTVQLPDRKLVFDPQLANMPLDTDAMVRAAMAYGREGGAFQVLGNYLDCKKSAYILDMEDFLQINRDYLHQQIEQTAAEVRQELVPSTISMDEEAAILTIQLGYNGRSLDVEGLYEAVLEAYASGDLSDLVWSYELLPYEFVDLQSYYNEYCTSARNAYYDKHTGTVVPEVVGYGFDLVAANAQLALAEEGSTIEIPLKVMEPDVTLEQYMSKNFADTLASYKSPYPYNPGRTKNLVLACEAIDGTVLEPGEVFSFNSVVGERTPEKGYQEGIIYADGGKSELEPGGGICQVVSSVYMCALTSDLQIVEREPHMYVVGYVPYGCDATVYWGAVDFKFKNTNSTPIMIKAAASDGTVRISFMGTNEHDYTIKMTSECVETIPYEEIETVDETKEPGYREQIQAPHTGYVYWSYKNFYDLNGAFLRKEKCAISEYKKYDAKFIVGPEEEEEEEDPFGDFPWGDIDLGGWGQDDSEDDSSGHDGYLPDTALPYD